MNNKNKKNKGLKRSRIAIYSVIFIVILIIGLYFVLSKSNNVGVAIGDIAPNATFTLINGTKINLYNFHGKYVLLYFIVTWCETCAEGLHILSQIIPTLTSKNITVIVVESYNDLGYQGIPLNEFIKSYANSNITFYYGYATLTVTKEYNPKGYLDIYYLISPSGKIIYKNTNFPFTYPSLLNLINSINNDPIQSNSTLNKNCC